MSLFGRSQDRLTHVLVDDRYFFQPDFFYPTPYPRRVTGTDGASFDASEVEVTLADIPFVRLRAGLPETLLRGQMGFSAAVAAAQNEYRPRQLSLQADPRALYCGDTHVPMKPVELAFYLWFVQRRIRHKPAVRWSDPGLAAEFRAIYASLFGEQRGEYERVTQALRTGMSKEYFESRKSRSNAALRKALGAQQALPYLITAQGKRPETRFAVVLPVERIELGEWQACRG